VPSGDPLRVAALAAQGFEVLQCEECAARVKTAMQAIGQPGELIEIRSKGGRRFLICLSYDGGAATITENGRHVAIRVSGMVFDNLHPDGMPFDSWIRDFDAIEGFGLHSVTAF
jgi:Papain fold toxin 2